MHLGSLNWRTYYNFSKVSRVIFRNSFQNATPKKKEQKSPKKENGTPKPDKTPKKGKGETPAKQGKTPKR